MRKNQYPVAGFISNCLRSVGFSLIELLLVVTIIGLLMAFIIPRFIAARIEMRHELVRQSCSELTGTVQKWIEKSKMAQNEQLSVATIADYAASLANRLPADHGTPPAPRTGQWIATSTRPNNWNNNNIDTAKANQRESVYGRWNGNRPNSAPENVVEDYIPSEKAINNPFTAKDIFRTDNDPLVHGTPIPGAIAFCSVSSPDHTISYGFCFQGHDSTTVDFGQDSTFHGRQNLRSLQGLINCTLFAQYR
jgi:prepilin-type N-terminal cleavage/methylation domain-containing protein